MQPALGHRSNIRGVLSAFTKRLVTVPAAKAMTTTAAAGGGGPAPAAEQHSEKQQEQHQPGQQKRQQQQHAKKKPLYVDKKRQFDQLETPFKEVGIDAEFYSNLGRTRTRQHRNPLIAALQKPAEPLSWAQVYPDSPSAPLVLDIGAGYGRFLLTLATKWQDKNMLGLEIRGPVITRANTWAEKLGLKSRVHFAEANATVSLESMLGDYPGTIDWVMVQYPDPHFKKKHHKRRVVQPALVQALAKLLQPGAKVLLQSDVLVCAEDMRDKFEAAGGTAFRLAAPHSEEGATFLESSAQHSAEDGSDNEPGSQAEEGTGDGASGAQAAAAAAVEGAAAGGQQQPQQPHEGEGAPRAQEPQPQKQQAGSEEASKFESTWAAGGWLKDNPVGVPTEREVYVLAQGLPVYRVLLERTDQAV